jgi:hypothetical protein
MQLTIFNDLGNLRSDVVGWWAFRSSYRILHFDTNFVEFGTTQTIFYLMEEGYLLIQVEPR